MLDPAFRSLIKKPLDAAGRWLAGLGLNANQVTIAGLGLGLAAAIAIALGGFAIGLFLFLLSRIADGLDGVVARLTMPTDQGGFLDIALDFFVYAAIPLAFAVYDPSNNAFSAALLLASFLANGTVFLAFAILAEKRALVSDFRDARSIYYIGGIAEGSETIAFFTAFCCFLRLFRSWHSPPRSPGESKKIERHPPHCSQAYVRMIEIHGRLTLSHAMRKAFRVLSSITGDPEGESALTASLSVAVDQLELDLIADDQVLIAQDLADVHEDVDVRPSRRC